MAADSTTVAPGVAQASFRAMGSEAHVIVAGGPGGPDPLLGAARARIDELERRWSRFIPDSEVSELNRRSGEAMAVSGDTRLLVERAAEAWRLTGGMYDPTVLGDVIRAGYDRSFDELGTGRDGGFSPFRLGCPDIEIDGRTVRLPAGVGFDPGGIGKGLAADLVVAELLEAGAAGVCVNLGGDLRVAGDAPEGTWTVGVEHPRVDHPIAFLGLAEGAVATSTTLKRRWQVGGEDRHHLIDPATGLPSDTDVAFVVVVTGEAWRAEVMAKAALLRGSAYAFDLLEPGDDALAVTATGRVTSTPGLRAYLGPADLPASLPTPA